MKKQRWRFTKPMKKCTECGDPIYFNERKNMAYEVCSETCWLHSVGMSWSDFL